MPAESLLHIAQKLRAPPSPDSNDDLRLTGEGGEGEGGKGWKIGKSLGTSGVFHPFFLFLSFIISPSSFLSISLPTSSSVKVLRARLASCTWHWIPDSWEL